MRRTIYAAMLATVFASCSNEMEYDATGIFEATTVTVSAETAGKIISLPIEEGDSVKKGQIIAVIDTTELLLKQKQIESQRMSAESSSPDVNAQAASLREEISHQRQECERQRQLLVDGATTRKAYDDAQSRLNMLNAQLTGLLSSLDNNRNSISESATAMQYQSQQIAEVISKSVIKSPLTGTVLEKYAEEGEYATPGRRICKLADMDKIYLRSYFTASQLADIRVGQEVTVIADYGGDNQFEYRGVITWIAEESEFTPKSIQTKDTRANLVYAVKIAVNNDGKLKLGQYGEVRL